MSFKDILNYYLKILNCSAKELSIKSGVSASVISRYRKGERVPNSEQIEKLSKALYITAKKSKSIEDSYNEILKKLNDSLNIKECDFESFRSNLNTLINSLNISIIEMSKYINYDPSYISRIRNGHRKPADLDSFSNSISNYIFHKFFKEDSIKKLADCIGCNSNDLENKNDFLNIINSFLYSSNKENYGYINDFLQEINNFDLNEYIRVIHFDKMKVPYSPIHFKVSKNYYGIEEMKKGEIDFFKSTILSKNTSDVFMCSDMPMEDMAEDIDFGKKWMYAIALMLKKGLHLNVIHNLNRPIKEMMIGLESWIPIYMTGQITPYYFKKNNNNNYCHLNYFSGTFALTGECVNGCHNNGKYYLTNNKSELKYYKNKCDDLLKKAVPLINIYKINEKDSFLKFMKRDESLVDNRNYILSVPPLFTFTEDLLLKILKNYNADKNLKMDVINIFKRSLNSFKNIINHCKVTFTLLYISEEEFNKHPVSLDLNTFFYEDKIIYSYQQYVEHVNNTKKFFVDNNINFKIVNDLSFRNIQIMSISNKYVLISKNSNPVIHFVINHPILCHAIENFIAPIIE